VVFGDSVEREGEEWRLLRACRSLHFNLREHLLILLVAYVTDFTKKIVLHPPPEILGKPRRRFSPQIDNKKNRPKHCGVPPQSTVHSIQTHVTIIQPPGVIFPCEIMYWSLGSKSAACFIVGLDKYGCYSCFGCVPPRFEPQKRGCSSMAIHYFR